MKISKYHQVSDEEKTRVIGRSVLNDANSISVELEETNFFPGLADDCFEPTIDHLKEYDGRDLEPDYVPEPVEEFLENDYSSDLESDDDDFISVKPKEEGFPKSDENRIPIETEKDSEPAQEALEDDDSIDSDSREESQ